MKPVILTLTGYYLPGYRGGGPIRTIANMVDQLSADFEFRIVTHDRDLGDIEPYEGITPDEWTEVGDAKVLYSSPSQRSWRDVLRLVRKTPHDILYLHGFFDAEYTVPLVLARWLGLVAEHPVVIAPRGEFSDGAYRLKKWKKAPFVAFARTARLYDDVVWHASTAHEVADIKRVMGASRLRIHETRNIVVAPDLVEAVSVTAAARGQDGASENAELRVCFLSRISPKKNLDFALRVLAKTRVPARFDIYGPIEASRYWQECQGLIAELPGHIRVNYGGGVEHASVRSTIGGYNVFFLPTKGENFGHVFLEAWSAGVPVLMSDQTPWLDLESRGLGWALPLDRLEMFVAALESAAGWDATERSSIHDRCISFATEMATDQAALEMNRRLFRDALDSRATSLASGGEAPL